MKILCMVCDGTPEIEETQYPAHMQMVHGGSQATGRMIKNSIPPAPNLPNGVTPADLPTPEFMEVATQIDNPPPPEIKPPVAQPTKPQTIPEKQLEPIQLTYKYIGNCPNGHSISTLEMDVEGKHFVVAYCLAESKQIESREVVNLKKGNLEGKIAQVKTKINDLAEQSTSGKILKELDNPPFKPLPSSTIEQTDLIEVPKKKAGRPKK